MAKYSETLDLSDSGKLVAIAKLPETYELALHQTGDHEKALQKMYDSAPTNLKGEINLARSDNTTAVMAYDKETNSLTVTFDPTLSKGTVFNNADKWDNFTRGPEIHSIGGEVHGGLYEDLIKDNANLPCGSLIETVNAVIYDYASRSEQTLNVNFTGFSKGGAQAALAAAEVTSTGIFDDNPNIKLNNVISFAPPGYGNAEFVQSFENKASELGANVWTVELHGDPVPTVLTPDGTNYFTQYDYGQFGNRAYLTQQDNGHATIAINPSHDELLKLRERDKTIEHAHRSDSYLNAIQSAENTLAIGTAENIPQQNQAVKLNIPTM